MSAGGGLRDLSYALARVQARYGELPTETEWRRISGVRGLGAWLEEARGGPLRDWIKGFSAVSDPHDIEAGVRNLLFAEIDALAGFVPPSWEAAVSWTRWLPLVAPVAHLRRTDTLPAWAKRSPPIAELLDDDGELQASAADRAGLSKLLDGESGHSALDLWQASWRACWPSMSRSAQAELDDLCRLLRTHLSAFGDASPKRAWGLRQGLRERLRVDFHHAGRSPAALFIYLALLALDLERLRRALLDRALFPEAGAELMPGAVLEAPAGSGSNPTRSAEVI